MASAEPVRRSRNLTLFEGTKSSPLHARRNTSAPNFPLAPQPQQQPLSSQQDQEEQDENAYYLEQEGQDWYDGQYEEYAYPNEWEGGEYVEQGEYQDQQYQQEEYPAESYPVDGNGQYLEDPNAAPPEDDTENAPYEISVGSGLLQVSNAASVSTTPSKRSISQKRKQSTTEELSLKIRGQEILLQQSLQQLKAVEDEKQTLEMRLSTEMSELNEVNQKLREEIEETVGRNHELEERLRKSMETVSDFELKTKKLLEEEAGSMKLLETKDSLNMKLKSKIAELEREMKELSEGYQVSLPLSFLSS
jgi:hypothetical protein